jgi:hypothetical protein
VIDSKISEKFSKSFQKSSIKHGLLDAILSLTKMTQKTETGDGCGVMSGAVNNGF